MSLWNCFQRIKSHHLVPVHPIDRAIARHNAFSRHRKKRKCIYSTEAVMLRNPRKADTPAFQKEIEDHFVSHGLDTITYVPDPADATRMVSIVEQHTVLQPDHGTLT